MSHTIIRRKPHTSEIFRSEEPHETHAEAIFVIALINIAWPDKYIRHIERF